MDLHVHVAGQTMYHHVDTCMQHNKLDVTTLYIRTCTCINVPLFIGFILYRAQRLFINVCTCIYNVCHVQRTGNCSLIARQQFSYMYCTCKQTLVSFSYQSFEAVINYFSLPTFADVFVLRFLRSGWREALQKMTSFSWWQRSVNTVSITVLRQRPATCLWR